MGGFPSEAWWFARIPPHPAPASLRLQYRMAALLYLLILGIPTAADLILEKGSYQALSGTFATFTISSNVALVVLICYFIRSEGGTWRPFWNGKFVPNVICLVLTPLCLFVVDHPVSLLFDGLIGRFPRLAAYVAWDMDPRYFPPSIMLPLAASMIASQEIVARAFLMTRMRQSGSSLRAGVIWSTALFSVTTIGWGIDIVADSILVGAILSLIYARWGGLAGIMLGRFVWEVSNYL